MQILEQNLVPKNPSRKSEDGILVTADFVAVIDGSTSKASRRYSLFSSNGRYCMKLVASYIRHMQPGTSCAAFCAGVTASVRKHYRKRDLPWLAEHPEERLAASVVVFSRLRREVWMVGDCQCLVDGQLFDNPKPYEDELARQRADIIACSPKPEAFLTRDTAREAIIPHMLAFMQQQQNKTYAVIDGFPVCRQGVRELTLDFQPHELVLASDGYPVLMPTLAESEARLDWQREHDPLNIGEFKATKGFMQGSNSFDDRSYIVSSIKKCNFWRK